MDQKKEDRRIQYTKRMLQDAVFELLKEKSVNEISVTELCAKANINRGSFYKYYTNIYDLLYQIKNKFLTSARETVDEIFATQDTYEMFVKLLVLISNNREIFSMITNSSHSSDIINEVAGPAYVMSVQTWLTNQSGISEEKFMYIFNFLVGGAVFTIGKWLDNECKEDIPSVAKYLAECTDSVLGVDE